MILNVNGIPLFYDISGNGPPMILLHGNGEDHHIFDPLAEKLASHFTVYALDSRNHGKSGKGSDYSYNAMADDVYAFIKELKLENVNVTGFSDGAIICLILAMNHYGAIKRMALLGVNLKPGDFTDESYAWVKETFEKTHDPLFKLMLTEPQIEIDDVKKVTVPTLLVAGEYDIYKPEMYKRLLKTLPSATLKIMEGHDHDSYIAGTDILYNDLKEFFK